MLNEYENININYDKINDLTFPAEPFILIVNWNNVKYEFLIKHKKNAHNLLVFGSGAYDSTKMKPPIFQRHSWIKHFEDDSFIFYNDPTLYLGKMNLGWGQGTTDRHYLKDIATIVEIIMNKMTIAANKVLFYGSSAGGFMSLMLAGFIKGSVALVNNPQTVVPNYYERHVKSLYQNAYPGISSEEIENKYKVRLDIVEFYKQIKYVPSIYYLQNISCNHDVVNHLEPFIHGLKGINDDFTFNNMQLDFYFDKEKGHNPLDLDESLYYIYKIKSRG